MEPTNTQPPPFWSPPATHRRRPPSPPLLSLPLLIILLPTLALVLLFFAIRPFLSFTSQFLRPSSVKKSWDSFNVFLVLIAVICGIFVRRNDDASAAGDVDGSRVTDAPAADAAGVKGNGESEFSQRWFGVTERRFSDPVGRTPGMGMNRMTRLRRNSSYPDLRQESFWESEDRPQFRFFDDFEINKHRSSQSTEIKVIPVDSFVVNPSPERLKSPAPSPPPLPVTQRKPRRTYQTIQSPPSPPPLPPRPVIPPSPVRIRLEEKFGKSERKKTNVKKEIAMALASLYKQKKKRKREKRKSIYEAERPSPTEPRPPPSPPPPPPPPSMFRGLFKKASKNKRVHSESAPPPPPPPPPPVSFSSARKIQIPPPPSPPPPPRQRRSSISNRPPLPTRFNDSYTENTNNRRQSPLVPIPPPPLFRTTEPKAGDVVGLRSAGTSRCGSPEPDNGSQSKSNESSETVGESPATGVGGVGPVFCPSPDVNIKAANFIARLRGEWRLEKMNSVREREELG